MGSQYDDGSNNGGRRRETRWCAVTGGRGFMARHLVAALLRSGEWRVRVTDLPPTLVLGPGETEEILSDALHDGRAVYASHDVCNLEQLIKAFKGVEVVFHTAAADPGKNNLQLHYKVNVEGRLLGPRNRTQSVKRTAARMATKGFSEASAGAHAPLASRPANTANRGSARSAGVLRPLPSPR